MGLIVLIDLIGPISPINLIIKKTKPADTHQVSAGFVYRS